MPASMPVAVSPTGSVVSSTSGKSLAIGMANLLALERAVRARAPRGLSIARQRGRQRPAAAKFGRYILKRSFVGMARSRDLPVPEPASAALLASGLFGA
ncbi:MAG TPA: hypothetical protein VHT21_05085 [Stellaceae bacterium]|nr:hypothetical protein [Stellaceae bacterium]